MANNLVYPATGLTGGTDHDLDGYDGALLTEDDPGLVVTDTNVYIYTLKADGAVQSSPDVIVPATNPGLFAWHLVTVYAAVGSVLVDGSVELTADWDAGNFKITAGELALQTGATIDEFSIDGTLAGDADTVLPTEKAVKTYVDALTHNVLGGLQGGDVDEYYHVNSHTQNQVYAKTAVEIQLGLGDQTFVKVNQTSDIVTVASSDTIEMTIGATGCALKSGTSINEFSTDGTLVGDSDDAVPTEKAVKAYADGVVVGYLLADGTVPLTAHWNAGAFVITANGLIADSSDGIKVGSADWQEGFIDMYSDGAGSTVGPQIRLFVPPDHDDIAAQYQIKVSSDEMQIGHQGKPEMMVFRPGGDVAFLQTLYVLGNNIYVGADDDEFGGLTLYGNGTGSSQGGRLIMNTAMDYGFGFGGDIESFYFQVAGAKLEIGTNMNSNRYFQLSDTKIEINPDDDDLDIEFGATGGTALIITGSDGTITATPSGTDVFSLTDGQQRLGEWADTSIYMVQFVGIMEFRCLNTTYLSISAGSDGIGLKNGIFVDEFSNDGTLAGDSDKAVPTEKAVKTYVDGVAPNAHTHDGDTLQLDEINSDGGTFAFTTTDAVSFNQSLFVGQDDVQRGVLTLYGSDSALGGMIRMHTADDADGTHEYWQFELNNTSYDFGPEGDPDRFTMTADGNFSVYTDFIAGPLWDLVSTNAADAAHAILRFKKEPDAAHSGNKTVGSIHFDGEDDSPTFGYYAIIDGQANSVSAGAETGRLIFRVNTGGEADPIASESLRIEHAQVIFNNDSRDVAFIVKTDSVTALDIDGGTGVTTFGASVVCNTILTFDAEYDNGTKDDDFTLDLNNGQKQKVVLDADLTITLTPPTTGVGSFTIKFIQDDTTGNRDVTWPASVWWPSGAAPNFSGAVDAVDVIVLYYDGTNYLGQFGADFS